jgi:hypothetical protein
VITGNSGSGSSRGAYVTLACLLGSLLLLAGCSPSPSRRLSRPVPATQSLSEFLQTGRGAGGTVALSGLAVNVQKGHAFTLESGAAELTVVVQPAVDASITENSPVVVRGILGPSDFRASEVSATGPPIVDPALTSQLSKYGHVRLLGGESGGVFRRGVKAISISFDDAIGLDVLPFGTEASAAAFVRRGSLSPVLEWPPSSVAYLYRRGALVVISPTDTQAPRASVELLTHALGKPRITSLK